MRLLLLLLVFAATTVAQQPKAAKPAPTQIAPELIGTLETHPGLVYARYGERELQLDLFRPKAVKTSLPAIVCVHGGGWFKGDRSSMTNLAQALAAKGFVTTTISYRLSGEAKFPAAIHDCKAAVRFLRANAAKFGVDRSAIGVTGLSAGGHLAALLATSGGVEELEGTDGHVEHSSTVQACVAMGAQSDLESPRIAELSSRENDPFYRTFLGDAQVNIPKIYALASPRHHLDKSDPPLLFMTGDLDDPSTHADETRRDLMKLGLPTGLAVLPQAPHAFLGRQKAFDTCVSSCDAFFTLHLKQGRHPTVACEVPGIFKDNAHWELLGSGYAGCEGAQWLNDTLLFAAHHDRFAFQWSPAKGLRVWRDDSPEATSFRPDGKSGFYVVEQGTRRLTRWNAEGQMTAVLVDQFEGHRLNRPNDCVVDRQGRVWFTDPDFLFTTRPEEKKELPGQFLFCHDPNTATLRKAADGFDKPNGLAFSPDESHLFITDSAGDAVLVFPVNEDGTLGMREVFARLPEKGLDGLAFDPAGRLWCCTRDGVRILDANGRVLGLLKTPGKPTSIAFGANGQLCVTTRDACWVTRTAF